MERIIFSYFIIFIAKRRVQPPPLKSDNQFFRQLDQKLVLDMQNFTHIAQNAGHTTQNADRFTFSGDNN